MYLMTLAIAVLLIPMQANAQGIFGDVPDLFEGGDIFGASLLSDDEFTDTDIVEGESIFGPVPDLAQPGVFGEVPKIATADIFGPVPNVLEDFVIGEDAGGPIRFEPVDSSIFGPIPNLWQADIFGPVPDLTGDTSSFTSFTWLDW